jgi:hypothetical protein
LSHHVPDNTNVNEAQENYRFWFSDTRGLIRQLDHQHPEVWTHGRWHVGSAFVMDAITGMGEDPHSCGEYADQWTHAQAAGYAARNRIDLFAPI